ncbi:acetyltransferase [Phaeosphaeriaceae sp. PMI808]|nr:acetyltransferase [Phaeosphaeriaceae sp. PMI808]
MELDVMGTQSALFKLYTQLAFVFPAPDSKHQSTIVSVVTRGLERLDKNFPWVTGQVVNTNSDPKAPPTYKIRPLESVPRLIVRKYEADLSTPTFAQMKAARFPMSMMGEELWAPCPTVAAASFDPTKLSGAADSPAPVLLVQLSFIKGAVVLCVNMQHNTCDMMGQAAVLEWLSKACNGKEFTQDELDIGNMDRRGLVPLIEVDMGDLRMDLEDQLLPDQPTLDKEQTPATSAPQLPPECSWIYCSFSACSLKRLKEAATVELPKGFDGYISTDDTISAFIFKSLLCARKSRLPEDACVTFARAVDARRYLGVHKRYPGILQNMTYTKYLLSALLHAPVGQVAAAMRRQVDPSTSDIARRTRALITYLSGPADNISNISFTARLQAADIAFSSWTKVPAYEWDFGLGLGSPAVVRRPGFLPVESLMYAMPKDSDGAIAVAMCLRREDIEQLRQNVEWMQTAEVIG